MHFLLSEFCFHKMIPIGTLGYERLCGYTELGLLWPMTGGRKDHRTPEPFLPLLMTEQQLPGEETCPGTGVLSSHPPAICGSRRPAISCGPQEAGPLQIGLLQHLWASVAIC